MRRVYGFLLSVFGAALLTDCVPWTHGPRISPAASGLVGEWVGAAKAGSSDTTLWRFMSEGTLDQVRIKPSHKPQVVPFGAFRVYADTGRTQLICFSFRRGRARPGCRHFEVDTLSAAMGVRRQLRLLDWVGEKGRIPETWIEKAP